MPYCIIAVMPFIWYLLLNQHSYTHICFTYRSLLILLINIPIILQKLPEPPKIEGENNETIITHMLCTMQRILHR